MKVSAYPGTTRSYLYSRINHDVLVSSALEAAIEEGGS